MSRDVSVPNIGVKPPAVGRVGSAGPRRSSAAAAYAAR